MIAEHAKLAKLSSVTLDLLSRFPSGEDSGAIDINDSTQEASARKESATLSSLMELAGVRSRLIVQLRSKGMLYGFTELQQRKHQDWQRKEIIVLEMIADSVSQVVQHQIDQSQLAAETNELRLLSKIAKLCRDSSSFDMQELLTSASRLVGEHMGFNHGQVYLIDEEADALRPQMVNGDEYLADLAMDDNPFANVFRSGKGRIVNVTAASKKDEYFKYDTAIVLPLISHGERFGTVGWWERCANKPNLTPSDRELGKTIATTLAQAVHIRKLKG